MRNCCISPKAIASLVEYCGQLQPPQINSLQLSRENQANAQISTKTTNEGTIRVSDHPSTSRFIPTIRNSTITFKSNFPFTRKIPFDVCHTWNAPAASQQKIFVKQVFELHRLIKVQRLIAGSPHVLLEDNLLLNKPPPKTSTTKKFQSDFASQKPSSVVKLDNKSVKVNTAEKTTNSAVGKIPIPCISNITKGHANQLPNYGNHLGNHALASADSNSNSKQSPSYVYPPPGNQWLVPVMSPFEGLVYKPIIWPCPPNAGFMAPING
ncbi:ELF3-like protein 2 [Glycine soja]|uniref:ELF3-like protein 2 n=2 Tax=Glycine soja TaxID=3848 RepID=A0A445GA25_GLYSO|nr:ELF3-like protein 2 [Glycine soja]